VNADDGETIAATSEVMYSDMSGRTMGCRDK
jgi:hypothetical protein